MEHLNRVCKECITGLGANKTTTAIQRIGKAMGPLEGVLDNFDKLINASAVSGRKFDRKPHPLLMTSFPVAPISCLCNLILLCVRVASSLHVKWPVKTTKKKSIAGL